MLIVTYSSGDIILWKITDLNNKYISSWKQEFTGYNEVITIIAMKCIKYLNDSLVITGNSIGEIYIYSMNEYLAVKTTINL